MEDLGLNRFWKNRRVLVTGHTGFKGAWLALWLRLRGAEVIGIGLEPEQDPGLLDQLGLVEEIDHNIIDVRNAGRLQEKIEQTQPEIVFHLAAQALVRRSYELPADTWKTNVIGTINLLDALRSVNSPFTAVIVTSDKVYLNREWDHGYREPDHLGGHDPYSSSKAAAELAVDSWRKSFFLDPCKSAVASARAGNVIGGGDWAEHRIVPDIVRCFSSRRELEIRCPESTRPWQHVLVPLGGYLELAERLRSAQEREDAEALEDFCSAWNFGPLPESNRTVRELVEAVAESWPGRWTERADADAPHEAKFLGLSIEKACRRLQWSPRWDFRMSVKSCVDWYQRVRNGESPRKVTEEQIREYECDLRD